MTRLDEIKARLAAATPRPWEFSNATDARGRKGEFRAPQPYNGFMLVEPWVNNADPEFIAHAPDDIAWLIAEVERLTNEIPVCDYCHMEVESDGDFPEMWLHKHNHYYDHTFPGSESDSPRASATVNGSAFVPTKEGQS